MRTFVRVGRCIAEAHARKTGAEPSRKDCICILTVVLSHSVCMYVCVRVLQSIESVNTECV